MIRVIMGKKGTGKTRNAAGTGKTCDAACVAKTGRTSADDSDK